MKLTAQVKLVVTPEQADALTPTMQADALTPTMQADALTPTMQADALTPTMQAANTVCDSLSAWAWEHQTFGQYPLHRPLGSTRSIDLWAVPAP